MKTGFTLLDNVKAVFAALGGKIVNSAHSSFTPAQQFYLDMAEGGDPFRDYKAPHAYRGTPPRRRLGRKAPRRAFRI